MCLRMKKKTVTQKTTTKKITPAKAAGTKKVAKKAMAKKSPITKKKAVKEKLESQLNSLGEQILQARAVGQKNFLEPFALNLFPRWLQSRVRGRIHRSGTPSISASPRGRKQVRKQGAGGDRHDEASSQHRHQPNFLDHHKNYRYFLFCYISHQRIYLK